MDPKNLIPKTLVFSYKMVWERGSEDQYEEIYEIKCIDSGFHFPDLMVVRCCMYAARAIDRHRFCSKRQNIDKVMKVQSWAVN